MSGLAFSTAYETKYQLLSKLSTYPDSAANARLISNALRTADVYAWDPRIAAAVDGSVAALPRDSVVPLEMCPPTPSWWWLDGVSSRWLAVLFWWSANDDALYIAPFGPMGADIVPAYGFWRLESRSLAQSQWTRLDGLDSDEKVRKADAVSAFVAAGLVWIAQRILVAPHHPVERQTRRRVLRVDPLAAGDLQIVALRKAEYESQQPRTIDGQTLVDWSCRWFVSGHWRQQYYPSTGQRQPRWVMPHLKGPSDKPIKLPGERLFAVVR